MLNTRFCERFSVELPLIQAGMAGNITTPEMVAAVSEAGGLGTLGAAYMQPDAIRQAIREIKRLTSKPFAVNLLLYPEVERPEVTPAFTEWLNGRRAAVGLPEWSGELPMTPDAIAERFRILLEEEVPVFSFAFSLPGAFGEEARRAGMKLIGTATTLEEALALQEAGVDAIVAQGGEAGGHRGTFHVGDQGDGACIGTLPLVALLTEALPDMPIIAAGGIMDGRGMIAALALGADAVQLGTRFLACKESSAHPAYKARLLAARETDTAITRAFSGRPARGVDNRFMQTQREAGVSPLPFPVQNRLTGEIRAAAARQNDSENMTLWAGQGVAMLREEESAAEIVAKLIREAERAAARIALLCPGSSRR
ncbi:nitronate monooxygenase [Brevibacillus sp. SYP-B805]|uniref:NAD(P)H-dependent flavin oxidoreductase n=1 Tax=Brevibacillus sp. SYP-B805 TaxID=1578199 RepID=UPI0013EC65CA|nr:nitronate monooxygenase [Brevibacillus sp. SYP-B805]NGQ95971.1 nitronate monooxygenase [Brevibacillus sp. SYP-B805]